MQELTNTLDYPMSIRRTEKKKPNTHSSKTVPNPKLEKTY